MEIIKYNGFEGSAELDMGRSVCWGKLLYIDDLVTYEAATPAELQREFEAAVDDYLQTCKEMNRPPKKLMKGQFNVRTTPALHLEMHRKANSLHVSLNEAVTMAFQCFVYPTAGVHHHEHFITIQSNDDTRRTVNATLSGRSWTPATYGTN